MANISFFTQAQNIVDKIQNQLNKVYLDQFGLLIGGGLGYDSLKYKNNDSVGDIDLICVLKNMESAKLFCNNKGIIISAGFDIEKTDKSYQEDFEYFRKGEISVIRFSGLNNNLKTTINFTTFDRLNETYINQLNFQLNKVSHGKSQNLIVSTGSDGSSVYQGLICADISEVYNDGKSHFLIPDLPWIKYGDYLYTGILTDFIGKGLIISDILNQLFEIQTKIRQGLKTNASEVIKKSGDWSIMFANNEMFSADFKKRLNYEITLIQESEKNLDLIHFQTVKEKGLTNLVFVPDKHYCSKKAIYDLEVTNNFIQEDLLTSYLLRDANNLLTREEKLYIINGECKILSYLYSISKSFKTYKLPNRPGSANYVFKDKKLLLITNEKYDQSILEFLKTSIQIDSDILSSKLVEVLNEMRQSIIHKLT